MHKNCSHKSWYSNVGTFLTKIKPYSHFEQFFSAGITNVSAGLRYHINTVPRDLIRLLQEYDFMLTDKVVNQYEMHRDIIRNIFSMEFQSITKNNLYDYVLNGSSYDTATQSFNGLVVNHKYNYVSLMQYIDNLMTYEAIDRFYDVIRELHDYANMMSALSPKYEKYPKNFLTTHRIACRNFNRLKQQFEEEVFQRRIKKQMEYDCGIYKFIYPDCTQDIKDEAVQQSNCLASYVQKVIDGKCDILFMRHKDAPEASLVTIEVRGNKIVQAKGKFNRDVTTDEQVAIDKYNERLERNLRIAC